MQHIHTGNGECMHTHTHTSNADNAVQSGILQCLDTSHTRSYTYTLLDRSALTNVCTCVALQPTSNSHITRQCLFCTRSHTLTVGACLAVAWLLEAPEGGLDSC